MLILTCASKLQMLEGVLRRNLPQTLPICDIFKLPQSMMPASFKNKFEKRGSWKQKKICGAVMHINLGNPGQHEVVVDSWPEFKVVLTRPKREVVKDNWDFYANLHAAFYWDENACRTLLEKTDVIDWGQAFQMQGLQDGLYDVTKHIAEAKHVHLKPYYYKTLMHPEPSTLNENRSVVKDNWDFYANMYAAFYWDENACRTLLEKTDVIDWGQAFQMQGLQDGLYDVTKRIAEAKHVHFKTYNSKTLMHPEPSTLNENRWKSDDLHVGTLNPSHATLLNETWDFGGNSRSLRYLDSLIRHFPSACLMDKAGQLVSWTLTDSFACLTHGYTLPQYRGQGCAGAVVQVAAEKLNANRFPLYCGVLAENHSSLQSLKHVGFRTLPWTYYMLILTPRNSTL